VAIVLDVLLEGEHFWQLLQDIKQNPQTKDVPAFVVTLVENEAKALALGATGFHGKPIDRAWLLDQLKTTLLRAESKILIVDDDEISRYLLKGLLTNRGQAADRGAWGVEGLRLARENKPNLIILDLSMPDMNGFEVLDELKKDAATQGIPVVIHTSQTPESQARERLQGAVDIVPKEARSRDLAESRLVEALASRIGYEGIEV
jgi:CheY-like chemotaxis protein